MDSTMQQEYNRNKASRLRDSQVRFADFGTRRRFSAASQAQVIADILSVDGNTLRTGKRLGQRFTRR
ncbi:MAG: hypothetical protein JXR76_15015 [Deltaproteobacteria bacterium]|nr:hypothetical protein [Deltaproteobacteria bacterium]